MKSVFRRAALSKAALTFGAFIFAFLIAEGALILANYTPVDLPGNLLESRFRQLYDYDPALGWTVKPMTQVSQWDTEIRTLNDGIRSNGRPVPAAPGFKVLALGDSFTFGDEVGDAETWPAQLEARLHKEMKFPPPQVLNAGVSSYGIDQMLLRAEKLVPKYRPDIVVIGFIDDDLLERPALSVRHGISKPFFVVETNTLSLKNVPVPPPANLQNLSYRNFLARFRTGQILLDFFDRHFHIPGSFHDYQWVRNPELDQTLLKILDEFVQLNRHHGAKTVFAYMRSEFDGPPPLELDAFFQKIQDLQTHDVLLLNYAGDLQRISLAESRGLYNEKWLGHWSAAGHARFTDRLYPLIMKLTES